MGTNCLAKNQPIILIKPKIIIVVLSKAFAFCSPESNPNFLRFIYKGRKTLLKPVEIMATTSVIKPKARK